MVERSSSLYIIFSQFRRQRHTIPVVYKYGTLLLYCKQETCVASSVLPSDLFEGACISFNKTSPVLSSSFPSATPPALMILELVSAQGPKRQMNVFAVALFAWSCQSATVGASDPRTVAGQKKEHELVETLASAEVAAPQLVARVLYELTLVPAELSQLDSIA